MSCDMIGSPHQIVRKDTVEGSPRHLLWEGCLKVLINTQWVSEFREFFPFRPWMKWCYVPQLVDTGSHSDFYVFLQTVT